MTNSRRPPIGQTADDTNKAASTAASRLARIARDQFWAARRAGDRPGMIRWSATESVLRRQAHGVTAPIPMPGLARAVG
jgi:hypothetical protein